MPRLTGPISVLALGILIVGFALDAEVWKSQSQFKVGLLTSEQALAPQPNKVDAEPRRTAPAGKQRRARTEPARPTPVRREAETAVTAAPRTDARARQVRSARTFRSRPTRPSGRERTRVGKAPITASPPATPVAPPLEPAPPAASPPPQATGGPPAPVPPPVSPSSNAAPVAPAPRVPVGAATPPARGVPDLARLPTSSTSDVLPGDEDGDESDGPDEENGFEVVGDARVDAEDGEGDDERDEEDEDEDD
jgi:hypothetical protein